MTESYEPRLSIEGTGAPVVLVPGLDGSGLLFYRQIPLLARSYRVASYALRDAATTMDELTYDLKNVVEAVAGTAGQVVLIGESFGGALAMSFALAHPQSVRRLIVLNSFSHFASRVQLWAAICSLHLMPWGAMKLVRRVTAFRLHSPHTHRREIERFMQVTARTTRRGYVNRLKILTRYDIRQRLGELQPPTLFLAADQDHLVPSVEQARFMASRVAGAVVRVLGGHGHICLIAPDLDLAQILGEWQS